MTRSKVALRILVALGLGLLLSARAAFAVTYANATTAFGWVDASTHTKVGYNTAPYKFNGGGGCGTTPPTLDDTISDNIPIGFTFMYGGVNFTQVRIMSNGRLQFNNNTTCGYGSPVTQIPYPDPSLNYTMRIYGNDLDPTLKSEVSGYSTSCTSRTTCYVSYATLGTAPYRSFVVTWNNIPEWTAAGSISGNYNLQIILQENGEFIYQYGVNTPGPQANTAQVGWQVDSNDYDVPAVGLPTNNSAIKFYIPRPIAEYRMEQMSWNGTTGEVFDTSGNARHGTAVGAAQTTAGGKVCRGANIPSNNSTGTIDAINTGISVPTTVGSIGTITFWYKPNNWASNGNQDAQLFDATTSSPNWFFMTKRRVDNSNVTLHFVIHDSAGNDQIVDTGNLTNAALSSGWVHIAVSWNFNALAGSNQDHMRIYVNGVQQAQSAFTTAGSIAAGIGTLYVGDNRSGTIGVSGTGRSADGVIDEFRIYNYEGGLALIQRDMNQTGACVAHYAIAISGTPSACSSQPAQVTVTAHDASHNPVIMPNNTTQITLYVSPSATPSTIATAATNGGTWSLVSGYGIFSDTTPNDGMATYVFDGEYQVVLNYQPTVSGNVYAHVTDGQIVESENSVISVAGCSPSSFNCVETGQAGGTGKLYTKLTGTSFGFDVFALRSDGTTTETGYTGPVKIELVDGSVACASATSYQTVAASQVLTSGKYTVPASGAGSVTAANAYQNVRCRVTDVNNSSLKSCSTDNFSIRPQSFAVTANLGGATLAAGNNFTLTAATAAGGGYVSTPVLNTTQVQDHNGSAAGVLNGSFGPATGTSATGTFQYHDVGTISLLADAVTDSIFTSVDQSSDCVVGSTSNTLSGGKYGCSVGSAAAGPFGRFYPHHFTYSATLTPACSTGGFTYMSQPALGINLSLAAKSANETTTTRYTAGYGTLGTFSITGDNGGTAVPTARLSPALPAFAWTNGVYATNASYAFTRSAAPDGPYDSFALKASVTDPDGATIAGSTSSNVTKVRYGRLRMLNAYGSELLPILLPVQAEYYNAGAWQINALDGCTNPGTANVAQSGVTTTVSSFPALANGTSKIKLAAPGAAGVTSLALNLGASGADNSCNATHPATSAANLPWLQYAWCTGKSDPNASARFGASRAPYIYLRERY